jgi:phage/plasmid-like protein (TIGR03299 family)
MHNLNVTDGKVSFFDAGSAVPAWHGLGTRLADPLTSRDAIREAGLDYEVDLHPVYVNADDLKAGPGDLGSLGLMTPHRVPGCRAAIRRDTGAVLGTVGDRYQVLQNVEAFEFMDAISGNGIRYHTAGALGLGERVWMLGKLDGVLDVRGTGDVVEKYLLLSNAHDGSGAVRVLFTPTRVVCANTLAAALADGQGKGMTIRHTGDVREKIAQAQDVLGLARKFYDSLDVVFDRLASVRPSAAQLAAYFAELYPDPAKSKGKDGDKAANPARAQATRAELTRLFESGRGQDHPGTRRTMFAAYNAVSEYLTHERGTRGVGDDATAQRAARLESAWFGDGAALNVRALAVADRTALDLAN